MPIDQVKESMPSPRGGKLLNLGGWDFEVF